MRKFLFLALTANSLCFSLHAGKALTLEEALDRGVSSSFGLQAASMDIAIKGAELYQAGLLPNPEFDLDIDNSGLLNPREKEPSLSYGIEQRIVTGKKRALRQSIAEANQEIADYAYLREEHLLRCAIERAFILVAELQEQVALAQAKKNAEEKICETLLEKAKQGKLALSERTKQEAVCAFADLEIRKKTFSLEEAKLVLSQLMGLKCPDFEKVAYNCDDLESLDGIAVTEALLRIKEWQLEAACRQYMLEEAYRVPDFSIKAGIVHEHHFRHSSLFFGVSVPLPVFDRNQASAAKASYEAAKLEMEKLEMQRAWESEVQKMQLALKNAHEEAACFRDSILKMAERALQNARESFNNGKIEFVDVLKEEIVLLDIKEKYLAALSHYYDVKMEFKKLWGNK